MRVAVIINIFAAYASAAFLQNITLSISSPTFIFHGSDQALMPGKEYTVSIGPQCDTCYIFLFYNFFNASERVDLNGYSGGFVFNSTILSSIPAQPFSRPISFTVGANSNSTHFILAFVLKDKGTLTDKAGYNYYTLLTQYGDTIWRAYTMHNTHAPTRAITFVSPTNTGAFNRQIEEMSVKGVNCVVTAYAGGLPCDPAKDKYRLISLREGDHFLSSPLYTQSITFIIPSNCSVIATFAPPKYLAQVDNATEARGFVSSRLFGSPFSDSKPARTEFIYMGLGGQKMKLRINVPQIYNGNLTLGGNQRREIQNATSSMDFTSNEVDLTFIPSTLDNWFVAQTQSYAIKPDKDDSNEASSIFGLIAYIMCFFFML